MDRANTGCEGGKPTLESVEHHAQNASTHFKSVCKKQLHDFQFKDWMKCDCSFCHKSLGFESVMEMGVVFTPQFLGDLTFSYLCPHCCSAFVLHIKCNIKCPWDIVGVFAMSDAKYEKEYQHVLVQNQRHNIVEIENNS